MLYILDSVLSAITMEIARHPPERGGALLGFPGKHVVTRFVPDAQGQTSTVTYQPSRWLNQRVQEIERDEGLEYKGIVHSHPGGMDHPSRQDAVEAATGLRLNAHMALYLLPIVTDGRPNRFGAHELQLERGKISFFAGYRTQGSEARVRTIETAAVPLHRDLQAVQDVFGGVNPEIFVSSATGVDMLAGRLVLAGDLELLVLCSELYPAAAPIVLVTPPSAATEQVNVEWQLDVPAERRLVAAMRKWIVPPGPYRKAFGPRGGPALTHDADRAGQAGWQPRYTGEDVDASAGAIRDGLFARSGTLLPRSIEQRHVLVAGVGSVGSYMAEQLVRCGVGRCTLLDPEAVEGANLSRTAYCLGELQQPKVDALARRLLSINPLLRVQVQCISVNALEPAALAALVRSADLVLAATDDPRAQRALNRFAYSVGRPGVFVGIYAGAQGGEVIITVPERTACYLCATWTRHQLEADSTTVERDLDYGTGRLAGVVALGPDIQHVSSAAVKIALTLLSSGEHGRARTDFLEPQIERGETYLTLGMTPNYWFYPTIFQDVLGQYAFQSVWLKPSRRPDCPVCGPSEGRDAPESIPLRTPRLTPNDHATA